MRWLRSAHLKAGMILSEELLDNHGRLLLHSGTRLTDAQIDWVHSLDLRGADVRDVPDGEPWPVPVDRHQFLDPADPYSRYLMQASKEMTTHRNEGAGDGVKRG